MLFRSCAGPLAAKYNAPILLTSTQELNQDTLAELKRLGTSHVIIVGGTGVVSGKIESKLKSEGIQVVERIWGIDRYETSVKIAERVGVSSTVALATAWDFPDALSISSIASSKKMPILLTDKGTLPQVVKTYIDSREVTKTYLIGGTGVISDIIKGLVPNPVRLGGIDRYETNVEVMKAFAGEYNFNNLYLTVAYGLKGDEFADALTGSVLAAKTSSPVLLEIGRAHV